ncbi:hypothetical protein KEJ48_04195 [Candidatus Bathyarchaeota archaeon]|nr:hypothetical protein [Candidatus Bathyarchaeota archaeon]MBS7618875.1 hypothetical protein [Candidatus Bathyarchaeota archaeon]
MSEKMESLGFTLASMKCSATIPRDLSDILTYGYTQDLFRMPSNQVGGIISGIERRNAF